MAAGFVESFPSPNSRVMGSNCAPLPKFSNHETPHIPPLPVDEYQSYMHLSPDSRKGIIKQGWLHKLSYHGRGWKKRYVVITEDCELQYWSHVFPFNGGTAQWELKGIVSLDDAEFGKVQNLVVDGHEGRFPVAIKISSQRSVSPKHSQWWILRDYYFAADENELEPWMREMADVKFKCEVELVDRAYCLTSSVDASDSPRSKLDSEYMFVEPRILLPLSRQLVLNTHNNMANATQLDKRQFLDGSCAPAWVLGWKYKVGPDSPRGNATNRGTTDQQTVHISIWFFSNRTEQSYFRQRLGMHAAQWPNDAGTSIATSSLEERLAIAKGQAHSSLVIVLMLHGAISQPLCCRWFGPDTICRVLRHIWNMNEGVWPCHTAGMLFVEDHCIYRDLAESVACSRQAYSGTNCSRMAQAREPCSWRPLIVVVPVRLGARSEDQHLSRIDKHLQSLGFIGGRPRHSYYFVGVRGYNAYYLDPHITQPYQSIRKNINVASFHCAHPGKMSLAHIDPSLALGFYCDDKSDFEDLIRRVEELAAGDSHPILSVGNRAPDYLSLDDVDEDIVTFEDVN
ncbi:hypothetical protein GUITHDRAFT_133035 [Guillardia theta CCMP2712]|uniref:Cysteine protease n=1 Tax=Guillardia theta (strain CCMP2712) TaxID=905079 RepID=L1JYA6_GUITC|nr:hypothetical protein GUITHDRAFT_133035 [Guillardia theta CCMP2712]EKX53294.1 hypothetical protein GUITHDRAFT_133035 [Guillardia theta CCMP2712]|eukprot:XP_005840274.1 hypothetical protein GUITHDRAFT_133035 [Guillardia theta CCMP2712]